MTRDEKEEAVSRDSEIRALAEAIRERDWAFLLQFVMSEMDLDSSHEPPPEAEDRLWLVGRASDRILALLAPSPASDSDAMVEAKTYIEEAQMLLLSVEATDSVGSLSKGKAQHLLYEATTTLDRAVALATRPEAP